jgi:hypothetical protein
VALASGTAYAGDRVAIVIGDNAGDADEVTLRFAETDAARVADALRSGGFAAEDVITLDAASASDVRRALASIHEAHALAFVYFSGHGDAESLHLGGTRLPLDELKTLVAAIPASAHVLVVDACRSGAITRVKGGTRAPAFAISVTAPAAEGTAILTSSAAGEDAQESDALGASFFTHHFVSALLGAADLDRDGQVTIDEAFAYAADRTVATTVASIDGPQHPTYRLDVAGRHDLVLVHPGATTRSGTIELADAGTWLVQKHDSAGPVVAEVTADAPGRRLAIDAGRYAITKRQPDRLLQGTVVVTAHRIASVHAADLEVVDYARVVRKGGSDRRRAWSGFALAGARGELLDLGTPWRVTGGARVDTAGLSYELRASAGMSSITNPRHGVDTGEASLAIAALDVIDRGRFAVGFGLLAGGGLLRQQFVEAVAFGAEPARNTAFALVGPLVTVDTGIARRIYARIEASSPTYMLRDDSGMTAHLTWQLGAGIGVYY